MGSHLPRTVTFYEHFYFPTQSKKRERMYICLVRLVKLLDTDHIRDSLSLCVSEPYMGCQVWCKVLRYSSSSSMEDNMWAERLRILKARPHKA